MYTVGLLLERPLSRVDAELVAGLHDPSVEPVRLHVLVPRQAAARPMETVIRDLAAAEGVGGPEPEPTAQEAPVEAVQVLTASLDRLRALGVSAEGEVVAPGRMLDLLAERVGTGELDEVVVLTRPHLVSETLHRDLASRARRRLGVPVLRLLAHSDPG